jgi:hypothetical protein
MHFDAGIVFARSSEVLRDRRGTCVAYATILAALARSLGIPSRIVMGYGYLDGMFGGHAWTEMRAGDVWIPIDAAIPAYGIADPARIAFAWSSLADGQTALMAPGAQLYGNLDARVVRYALNADGPHSVASGTPAVTIDGDTYRNTGLRLQLRKPNEFRFTSTDATWPSKVVVAMEGPGGARVTLETRATYPWQSPKARAVELASRAGGAGKAAKGFAIGMDIFVLIAEGANAPQLLDRVAATLTTPDE